MEDVPEVPESDQVTYARFLAQENYFAGMRVTANNAATEDTNEFW